VTLLERQTAYLAAFGYVVLPPDQLGSFGLDVRGLFGEVLAAKKHVYSDAPDNAKLMLPMMGDNAPRSRRWALQGVLPQIAEELIGEVPVVKPAKMTRFSKPTMWHRDTYLGLAGYKMGMYIEDDPVAFDLVAGSHHSCIGDFLDRDFGAAAKRPSADNRNPERVLSPDVPSTTLGLEPGSLLIFDLGLWHANLSSAGRLQWSVTYLGGGEDARKHQDLVDYLSEFTEYQGTYPRESYPYLPESWVAGTDTSRLATAASSVTRALVARGELL
jgi:hypothetical protein